MKAYVVMSTHENESAYNVHAVCTSRKKAEEMLEKVLADAGYDSDEEAEDEGFFAWYDGYDMNEYYLV